LVLIDLGLVLVNRSFGAVVFRVHKGNHTLWWVTGVTLTLLGAAVFSPAGRRLFHFGPLHADDLMLVAVIVASVVAVLELLKRFWRTRFTA
jgi:Ca2+-transporting ATPase